VQEVRSDTTVTSSDTAVLPRFIHETADAVIANVWHDICMFGARTSWNCSWTICKLKDE
jgi:hypothetical protein